MFYDQQTGCSVDEPEVNTKSPKENCCCPKLGPLTECGRFTAAIREIPFEHFERSQKRANGDSHS